MLAFAPSRSGMVFQVALARKVDDLLYFVYSSKNCKKRGVGCIIKKKKGGQNGYLPEY
jgi:hypothetical protein